MTLLHALFPHTIGHQAETGKRINRVSRINENLWLRTSSGDSVLPQSADDARLYASHAEGDIFPVQTSRSGQISGKQADEQRQGWKLFFRRS